MAWPTFVGRDREMTLLRERFERARQGRGQVVGIVGEPGVGKSRLLHELRRALEGERVTFLAGQCVAYGRSTPYLPVLEILKSNFQVEDGDNPLQIDEKLRRGVRALDPALETVLPFLRELLLLQPDEALKGLDARAKRQKTFEAIRALTAAGSERAPLVIAVEDLHWIDQTSEDYLAFLVESLAGLRVLVLTTNRPGHAVRWSHKTYYTQLALDLLGEAATAAIVQGLLRTGTLPDGLVHRVHEKAEGNPLFVEEITRSLLERGVLVREEGGVRWAPAASIDFPESAQDIIRARIDRLDEPVKRTAQVASVIGREFGERLLGEVVETASLLQQCLGTLKHVELVEEKRFFPELEYIFRHAIIQDVAYQSILSRRRKELHAAIGSAIESLYADRLREHYETLAHHFVEGDVRDKAREYLVKAGDKAAGVYANGEAVDFYERALPLLRDEDDQRGQADVLQKLAQLRGFYVVDYDLSRRYGEEALALYETLGDRPNIIATRMFLTGIYASQAWDGALEDEALPHAEALARLTESDPDSMQKGLIYQRVAHLYLHRSQPATALGWTRQAVDLFARLGVAMGTALGTALAYTGDVDEGLAYSEGNWELVRKLGNPLVTAVFGHELSLVLALLRDARGSRAWAERVLPEVLKVNSRILEVTLRRPLTLSHTLAGEMQLAEDARATVKAVEGTSLGGCPWEDVAAVGFLDLRRGRLTESRDYLGRMLGIWDTRKQVAAVSACSLMLAACDLEAGDHAAAESRALKSLDICRRGGNVLFELWVLPLLVELYLATGATVKATECVTRGFALLAHGQDWRGLPAPVHLARGNLAVAERRWDEAARDFEIAVAINRRHELPFDEAKTLAAWGRLTSFATRPRIGSVLASISAPRSTSSSGSRLQAKAGRCGRYSSRFAADGARERNRVLQRWIPRDRGSRGPLLIGTRHYGAGGWTACFSRVALLSGECCPTK